MMSNIDEQPTTDMVQGIAQIICDAVGGHIHTDTALKTAKRIVVELAKAPCDFPSVDEVARVSWVAAYGTDDFDATLSRCSDMTPDEMPCCISDQRKEAIASLALVRERLAPCIAAKDARIATLESPDGENLYDGCLCGEISPEDKPCLTCAARLSQWDAIVAERDALRVRLADMRDERDGALVNLGKLLMFPHPSELIVENNGLHERVAKLESLGPWIEAERVAELEAATLAGMDDNELSEAMHTGRLDAVTKCGVELSNRAGKDLRKEPTNEPVG